MSTSAHDSRLQIDFGGLVEEEVAPTADSTGQSTAQRRHGTIWLNGGVLACACPDCSAPMTIRLWLMTADCWRCGTSIELSLEQEREARRLLSEQAAASESPASPTVVKAPAARASEPRAPAAPRKTSGLPAANVPVRAKPKPSPPPVPPSARRAPLPPPPPARPSPFDQTGSLQAAELRPGSLLKDLPAWLVSLVFHLLLMILLGLLTFEPDVETPGLVLSVSVSRTHREGGEPEPKVTVNKTEYELPVEKEPKNEAEREALVEAAEVAKELRIDPQNAANLPDLSRVKADLVSSDPYRRMHAARDPRVRAEVVRREGGTTLTEAAVARALRWIAGHQNAGGSWSIDGFHLTPNCQGQCSHRGNVNSDTAGTALALLAMLGTGQTHKVGIYRNQVSQGLRWLVEHQKPDGDLRADGNPHAGMYAHGLASIVLCDAFKLTGDETLRGPAQRAIDFICQAQHADGGWRYLPGQAGDTSVVGWQLMATHSAKAAYLHVPKETMLRAGDFLDTVQSGAHGGLYAYTPRGNPTETMTAEGLLSRMYLGWDRSQKGLTTGVEFLINQHLPTANRSNIYYWYYGTQVMHHWGGEPWEAWNRAMREVLVTTQETTGHQSGSWNPDPGHGAQGGRLYMTALAACTLEVYYRYAPLYWQIDLN